MLRRSGILIVARQVAPIKSAKQKEVLWKKNGRRDRDGEMGAGPHESFGGFVLAPLLLLLLFL